jgi:site-specific DNA recombinase
MNTQRAAIYLRVSSSVQEDGYSLDTQLDRCQSHAREHGYEVIAVFREVFTGVELWERPQLTALREAVRRREVGVVIAYSIDRLSRDPVHLGVVLSEAEHAGVAVEFVSEPLDNSPEGQLIRFVRGYAAKIEHAKLVERTMRGKQARIAAGNLMHSSHPVYGYAWADPKKTRLVEDPITAPILKRMFTDVAKGKTLRAVAKELTDAGIGTSRGAKRWDFSSVSRILRNRAYLGEAFAARTRSTRVDGKRKRVYLPPEEWIRLPDGVIPPLVDPETFEAVQERLRMNQVRASRNLRHPEEFLLAGGIVRCGYCGYAMAAHRKVDQSPAYECVRRERGSGTCVHVGIASHILDGAVWTHVLEVLQDPSVIAKEVEKLAQNDPTADDLVAVERKLADVTRRHSNLGRLLASFDDDEAAAPAVAEMKSLALQRRQLEDEREALLRRREEWQAAQTNLASLEDWCRAVAGQFSDWTYKEKRRALDALGVGVQVFRRDHTPRYIITSRVGGSENQTGQDSILYAASHNMYSYRLLVM